MILKFLNAAEMRLEQADLCGGDRRMDFCGSGRRHLHEIKFSFSVLSEVPEPKSSEAPKLKEKVQGSLVHGKHYIFSCILFCEMLDSFD